METLKKISRGYDKFLDYWLYVPAVMVAALLVICALMVTFRRVLIGAFNWADEAMRFLMVYATFLSLPILVAKKKNITIDLTELFFPHSHKGQRVFWLLAEIMTLICCAVMCPVIFDFIKKNMVGYSNAMQIPMWVIYSCLPIGFVMSVVSSINNIFKLLTENKNAGGEEKEV